MRRRHLVIAALATLATLGLLFSPRAHVAAQSLPTSISDKDFWSMVVGFSEPGGFFRSDNLISNETTFQHVIPELQKTPHPGVYVGVGPGSELHLHHRAQAEDGVHHRHSTTEHAAAPDVQGDRGDVRRTAPISCRVCSPGRGPKASDPSRARRRCSTRSKP